MSRSNQLMSVPRQPLTLGDAVAAPACRGAAAPRVLLVDADVDSSRALVALLSPEACVIHVASVFAALLLVEQEQFALIVLDPELPDGDGQALMLRAAATPVLLYAARLPQWRTNATILLKRLTSHRQLWVTVSALLGIDANMFARAAR